MIGSRHWVLYHATGGVVVSVLESLLDCIAKPLPMP